MFKYLTLENVKKGLDQSIAQDVAQKIMNKYKDNLFGQNGLAVVLGERNFEFFCIYFLQNTFVPKDDNEARNLATVHLEIWQELQQMFVEDKWDKEEFILPRGCSKSTIINKALSCYVHCYKKSRYTIVIGNKEDDAVQFISDTQKMLQNPYILKGFGQLINRKVRTVNKQELELDNNTKIQAFSWGSSVRGTTYGCIDGIFRPSVIISDDILSENDILSDGAKEKVLNKFNKEVSEVGDTAVYRDGKKIKSASKFLVIGTPLAADCFINTVRKDATFKVFHRQVCSFDIDDYFENNEHWQHYKKILLNDKMDKDEKDKILSNYYIDNIKEMQFDTIWEKYRCDELAQKYFTKRVAFMQELMCSCENIGTKWFKSIRTQSVEEIENHTFIKTILTVDPASTTKAKSDYSAFVVGSEATNDFLYVRKGIIEKLEFPDLCNKTIELLKEYKDITHISIEKNTYNGTDVLKIKELIEKDNELCNRNITFINEPQRKNKDEKISTIVDAVNSGQIIFNEEDKDFRDQILDFAGQKYTLHDDAVDCVAEMSIQIKKIEVVGTIELLPRSLLF